MKDAGLFFRKDETAALDRLMAKETQPTDLGPTQYRAGNTPTSARSLPGSDPRVIQFALKLNFQAEA